jgi:CBS domain containing-hemolysin-like protein
MRGFMWVFRPVLKLLNESANVLVRRVGAEPTEEVVVGHSPDSLRHLLEHSTNVGALDARFSAQLSGALDLQRLTVRELLRPGATTASVPAGATVQQVRDLARSSGHLRILVGSPEHLHGIVHVRDTLTEPDEAPTDDFVRPVFALDGGTTLHVALARMRETSNHLAVVTDGGRVEGVVTLSDVLRRVFPSPATA